MDLALSVRWHWGGSKVIRASSASPISTALTSNGFSALPNTLLIVAHKGQVVNPQFTFHHYQIRTGDQLVCLLKRLPTREKSCRFLEALFPRKAIAAATPTEDDRTTQQVARLSDLASMMREARPGFPLVRSDQLAEQDDDGCLEPTILSETIEIAEDLFPMSCQPETVVAWKSVCGRALELMEQRRGNSFDQIKKP
jgi:hypothetical protein